MPVVKPATCNLGIAGALTSSLATAGSSDYIVLQLQTTASTPAGNVNQKTFKIECIEA
jgi:hypothetical protein